MQRNSVGYGEEGEEDKVPSKIWIKGKYNFPLRVKLHNQYRVGEVIASHILLLSFNFVCLVY